MGDWIDCGKQLFLMDYNKFNPNEWWAWEKYNKDIKLLNIHVKDVNMEICNNMIRF